MISNRRQFRTLCIDIVTYKSDYKSNQIKNMNTNAQDTKNYRNDNKFICSICLNQNCANGNKRLEMNERKSISCPLCQHSCNSSTDGDSAITKDTRKFQNNFNQRKVTKDAQTSQPDLTQGMSLLNEVLNVFQNKKQVFDNKINRKTVIYKDVGVSTEFNRVTKPKLTKSEVFKFSIEDKCGTGNKFTIINSYQPDVIMETRQSAGLIKHKSSSIPQMKLEELKHSLKVKTKSKDAVEEANRMFASYNRFENDSVNRPIVRKGPRILPVVKTGTFEESTVKPTVISNDINCKCPQESNDYLSRGDYSEKHRCNHCSKKCDERSNDSVRVICGQYKQNRPQTPVCKKCGKKDQAN